MSLPHLGMHDEIGHSGFIFERDEGQATGCPRPLAGEDADCNRDRLAVSDRCDFECFFFAGIVTAMSNRAFSARWGYFVM